MDKMNGQKAWLIMGIWLCFVPVLSFATNASLGQLSNDITGAFGTLTNIIFTGCYIIGAGLLVATGMRYMSYRKNRQQVRLGEVFSLLIFSLVMLLLPLLVQQATGAKLMREEVVKRYPSEGPPSWQVQEQALKEQQEQALQRIKQLQHEQQQKAQPARQNGQQPAVSQKQMAPTQNDWQAKQKAWQEQQKKWEQEQQNIQEKQLRLQQQLEKDVPPSPDVHNEQ